MTKSKFWLYFLLTSLIWGGCLYLIRENSYQISIIFTVLFTEFLRELFFKSRKEKELEREKYNQPITFKMVLKGLVIIILLVSFTVLFFKYYENFSSTMLNSLLYLVIGALWFLSIYKAWLKT